MKIAELTVKDFKSYESASIAFTQPLSIVRALNGKGKTSLQQAIELSLTWRTDGTDPRGAGANAKIRNGASKAIIDLVLETNKGPITLKTTYGPNSKGRAGSVNPPEFEKYMEANKERLSCVLNTGYFTSLDEKKQSSVLAGLVLPLTYEFDPAMKAMAEKHLGAFQWNQRPVALIEQVYSLAYDGRKGAKAALNAIYIPQRPAKPEHTAERIQQELKKLRGDASKETKNLKGGGSTAVGRLESELERANSVLADTKAKRDNATEALSDMKSLGGDAIKKHQKTAAGRRIFDELQAKLVSLNEEIHAQRSAQDVYTSLLAEPVCPTCSQAITKAFIDGKVKEHLDLENDAIEAQRGLLKEQQALGDIAASEVALGRNKQDEFDAKSANELCSRLEAEINEAAATVRRIESDLAETKATATAPPDTTALDALNAQIATWEALLGPATTYESTLAAIEAQTKAQTDQKAAVNDLETLCTYFGKDGVKAKLIQENIEAFSATVNSVLQTWGFTATFSFDPYAFLVTGDKGQLPLPELSGGETFMFCVALQCAIAVHGKIKIVIIDQADTLVDKAKNRLFGCVKSLIDNGQLDQAIILEASALTSAASTKADVATFQIVDGKVEAL